MALEVTPWLPDVVVRPAPLDRLPGSADDDPFLRLAAAWAQAHPANTARAYWSDVRAWASWCHTLGVHPLVCRTPSRRRLGATPHHHAPAPHRAAVIAGDRRPQALSGGWLLRVRHRSRSTGALAGCLCAPTDGVAAVSDRGPHCRRAAPPGHDQHVCPSPGRAWARPTSRDAGPGQETGGGCPG